MIARIVKLTVGGALKAVILPASSVPPPVAVSGGTFTATFGGTF